MYFPLEVAVGALLVLVAISVTAGLLLDAPPLPIPTFSEVFSVGVLAACSVGILLPAISSDTDRETRICPGTGRACSVLLRSRRKKALDSKPDILICTLFGREESVQQQDQTRNEPAELMI
jgi:hypothetical protein